MKVTSVVQSPEAYVYRVACNIAIDRLRSDRALQNASDVKTELMVVADSSPGPDRIAEARSDVQALHRALQELPRRHRAVLEALRIDELTRQEVATHHGISMHSVDTVLRQARDFSAERSGQLAMAGVRSPRLALLQGRYV